MSTEKASERKLSELHGVVAEVLTAQLQQEEECTKINEDGEIEATGETRYTVSPATIAAAIKFLKDNDISADIETNQNMTGLKDALEKKQKRSRMGSAEAAARLHAVE